MTELMESESFFSSKMAGFLSEKSNDQRTRAMAQAVQTSQDSSLERDPHVQNAENSCEIGAAPLAKDIQSKENVDLALSRLSAAFQQRLAQDHVLENSDSRCLSPMERPERRVFAGQKGQIAVSFGSSAAGSFTAPNRGGTASPPHPQQAIATSPRGRDAPSQGSFRVASPLGTPLACRRQMVGTPQAQAFPAMARAKLPQQSLLSPQSPPMHTTPAQQKVAQAKALPSRTPQEEPQAEQQKAETALQEAQQVQQEPGAPQPVKQPAPGPLPMRQYTQPPAHLYRAGMGSVLHNFGASAHLHKLLASQDSPLRCELQVRQQLLQAKAMQHEDARGNHWCNPLTRVQRLDA
eukprot:TRINITY_DN14352_c0_g1_i3.p1 TRINITY_DN14352_c0_g1~~TRINITY_DN14352_c0_g1_i3.p1  ORF type:complete len:350 (+),score=54.31 TRINITY_DN14352_c0_g1_i3:100-1149(+)